VNTPNRSVRVGALLLAAVACTPEATLVPAGNLAESDSTASDTSSTDTTSTDTTGTDTTIVRRGTLIVTGHVTAEDAGIAAQLGWTGGIIAGASVSARRGSQVLSGTTDSAGRVTFADILPGDYQISLLRVLTDAERALLAREQADVNAFGGGGPVTVAAPAVEVLVTARATRRGSLVISELFPMTYVGPEHYYFGTYVELYNNADTIIYLDGKLFGRGPFFQVDHPEYDLPCSLTQQWQTDSLGLWSTHVWRLPGTGRQYPLAPGEAAVMATDAVDHSVVDPRWPDLSSARFEFLGASDVDNPAAGNITLVGTPSSDDLFGHGPWFTGGSFYIADSVDVSTLPTVQPPNYRVAIPRIPRAKILDFVYFLNVPSFYEKYGFVLCPVPISPVFDTGPAFWYEAARFMSFRRISVGSVLLRSGSTVNDFEIIDAPTPNRVP
jgi:hypothetical protein